MAHMGLPDLGRYRCGLGDALHQSVHLTVASGSGSVAPGDSDVGPFFR